MFGLALWACLYAGSTLFEDARDRRFKGHRRMDSQTLDYSRSFLLEGPKCTTPGSRRILWSLLRVTVNSPGEYSIS